MKKHAFLIEAHNNKEQLEKLFSCLDNEYNDIYLHVDAKSKKLEELKKYSFVKSGYFIVSSVKVNWGGFSQIEAELRLLDAAIQTRQYARYHLISGLDLPLVSQVKLHDFFDSFPDTEFIHYDYTYSQNLFKNRMGLYHILRDRINRNQNILTQIEKMILGLQKIIGIDRTKGMSLEFGKGSNWFSITDNLARYTVSQRNWIEKTFKYTKCCDEVFLQTLVLNSEFKDKRFYDNREQRYGNVRAIDWKRGNPYIFRKDDFDWLISSGYMFARKFDMHFDSEVVDMIINHIETCC